MQHDLNDMMVFLAVVEAGSFTLAAQRLNIPKANISRKVSRLEERLEVTLLTRSTRSQHLTEAGKRYLTHCKQIHEQIDLAEASVCEVLNEVKGNIKIGTSVTIGQQILKPTLSQFLHQYPDINVELNLVNRRVNFIEEGFDLIIRVGKLDDSSLIGKKLGSIERKLFASTDYFKKRQIPQAVEQLAECDLLLISALNNNNKLRLFSADKEHVLSTNPRLLVDDYAILKQLVLDGLGIAVLPDYMCSHEIENGELIEILPEWLAESVDVYALYPKHRVKIPKMSVFLEYIIQLFNKKLSG
ncbi:LysR family transcriptional regulator [Vibrio splendidus]|uniref:LysR family transcriptional regulator n=1 Tax=Vibrio splendidus TaxID=29497 RepID=UPI000C8459D4|nr:LysR family transcriptional regulator [Vibrio splendidus]PMP00352.1 LysR family transcriptional regulator [Vibrio splendidus]PMP33617.1 LysR family transcriptional regulator [Vibrio splendidus]PMP39746.1 LysR family transcriptional regulator [Vibrio splendidus]PMP45904.1 LysR family transcriptional regulator [Vibrio splendidus]PMP51491.1 LysR family transcriptional regulator [Vibrio splendidus]